MVLQGMIDRLIEIGRCCEMKMHVDKTQEIKISRKPFPLQIYKKTENVEHCNYLGSMKEMMEDVYVKLNPRLPRKKQNSTGRRLFSPGNKTSVEGSN